MVNIPRSYESDNRSSYNQEVAGYTLSDGPLCKIETKPLKILMGRVSRTVPCPFDNYANVYSGELFWQ